MWFTRLCAGVLVALFPGVAGATSIAFQGPGKASLARIAVTGAGPAWANSTIWAREYRWRSDSGGAGYDVYDPTFYTYCADLVRRLADTGGLAARATDLLIVSGVPQATGKAAWRFNWYAPGFHSAADDTTWEKVDASQSEVTLQAAVWETMLDTSNDVLSGTFKVNTTAAVRTKAMGYLSALYRGGPSGYDARAATWLEADQRRERIELPGVPEPQSLALLATGLVALIVLRRRRRSRRSA